MKTILRIVTACEDFLLAKLQRRCQHPGEMVAADLLEGCADNLAVKYCRRCGAVKTDWNPHDSKHQFISINHCWRRPDPYLWKLDISKFTFGDFMKKLLFFATLMILFTTVAFAQDNTITFSATGELNGALPKTLNGAKLASHQVLPGGQVDLSAKLAGIFHLDLSVNYSQKPGNIMASYAGGPEVVFGKNNQLFGHALVGGIHLSQSRPKVTELADSAFVYYLGGGYRHFFGKHIGFALGADYGYSEVFHSSDSLWKTSAGLVVRF